MALVAEAIYSVFLGGGVGVLVFHQSVDVVLGAVFTGGDFKHV